jgi:hypothetical protein
MCAIFIQGKALLPDTLLFQSEPISNGWVLVRNLDRYKLERIIRDAGWTFFAGRSDFRAGVFGFDQEKTALKALQQVFLKLRPEAFNCLEVTTLDVTRVLGVLYVSLSARARRIREKAVPLESELAAV